MIILRFVLQQQKTGNDVRRKVYEKEEDDSNYSNYDDCLYGMRSEGSGDHQAGRGYVCE